MAAVENSPATKKGYARRSSLALFVKDGLLYHKRGKTWGARYVTFNEETGDLKIYIEKNE